MSHKCLTASAAADTDAASFASFAPVRRSGALAVHALEHFGVHVPDLQQAAQFYRTFGLEVREEGGELGLYAPAHPQRWVVLRRAARKRLAGLCFRAYPEDLAALRERAQAQGLALHGDDDSAFTLRDPDGLSIEIRAGGRLAADAKAGFDMVCAPAGAQAAWARSTVPTLPPRRLAHVAMFATDVDRSIGFYCGVLGLAVADRSGSILAFLHGAHGSDHHILALAKSEGPGLHHCSWDMGS